MSNFQILKTAYISLIIQFIVGIIGIYGILIPLKEKDGILTDILIMETTVQIIEFIFYIWLIFQLSRLSYDVTYTRYFDWFISTPIVLLSTIFFMTYLNNIDSKIIVTISSIINKKFYSIIKIVVSNFFMLLSGFLAEVKKISRSNGFILGTIALFYTFYIIYIEFVGDNLINLYLFSFMLFIWFIYGIAFLFPYVKKNTFYNFLDIFSKNFYGLFIFYIILKTANYI